MRCKDCGKEVSCQKHGNKNISEFQHDMDDSWYYSCDQCVIQDNRALGSIVHWCKELKELMDDLILEKRGGKR